MATKGWWPRDLADPTSPILPPTKEDLIEYKVRGFEGLSTFSDYIGGCYVSGGLAARSGRGERIGPAEETIKFTDGSVSVGGNPRSHYNVVQTYIRGSVANSHKLPIYNIWTAHEEKAKDDKTGLPIVGPEVFGQKATQHVPRWFANLLHLSSTPTIKKTKDGQEMGDPDYRLWLKTHFDPQVPNVAFKAKNAIPASEQKDVPAYIAGGGLAIGKYLDMLVKHGQLSQGL